MSQIGYYNLSPRDTVSNKDPMTVLEMCCFDSLFRWLLWLSFSTHGWIIIHLQTLLSVLFNLLFLCGLAALTAAAATLGTEAHARGNHSVPGGHGVQGAGQEVPVA